MPAMQLEDLTLFARVAALGTLSAAARERGVPVSQVSRAVSRLEKACGARLIHRSTHALTLTAEGESFLDYCRRIAAALDDLEADFADKSREASGRVRVAASTVVAQHLLLPSLAGLHARHPRLQIDLEVGDRLVDMAREGIDIAIRTGSEMPDTSIAREIGQLGRAVYAAPSYAARHGLPSTPAALAQHRLVANTAAPNLNQWPFIVDGRPLRLTVDGFWRSNDTAMVADLVLHGLGIGRLSTLVGEPLVAQQRLVRVLREFEDTQSVPIHAVTAGGRQRLPKIRACIDYWAEWIGGASPAAAARPAPPPRAARSRARP